MALRLLLFVCALPGNLADHGSLEGGIDAMRTFTVAFLVTVFVMACGSSSPTAPREGSFELTTILQVSQSGYSDPRRETIRSDAEWDTAWATLHAGLQPIPPRPSIDFDRSFVVLAAAGTRPNGCYSIEITDVRSSIEGNPVFDVLETRPGPGCVCTEALTRPAHAVRVTRFDREAEYLEWSAELAC